MKKHKSNLKVFIILIVGLAILAFLQVPRYVKSEVNRADTLDVIDFSVAYEVRSNKDTMLWKTGEILEQGRALYFFTLEPDLIVYPTLKANNSYEGAVDVDIYLENIDKDGIIYWSKEIQNQHYDLLLNGTENLPPIELDIIEMLGLSQLIFEELGLQRGARGSLQVRYSFQADLEEESLLQDVAFTLDSHGLIPPPDDQLLMQKKIVSHNSSQIMQARALSDYFECPYFRGYSILITVLIAFSLFTYSRDKKDEYSRYEKWVSKAIIPKIKEPDAYFTTLKELIDAAVELDKKVIYDEQREAYFLLDGDNWYVHKKTLSNPEKKNSSALNVR
jgi:hypothetical protein